MLDPKGPATPPPSCSRTFPAVQTKKLRPRGASQTGRGPWYGRPPGPGSSEACSGSLSCVPLGPRCGVARVGSLGSLSSLASLFSPGSLTSPGSPGSLFSLGSLTSPGSLSSLASLASSGSLGSRGSPGSPAEAVSICRYGRCPVRLRPAGAFRGPVLLPVGFWSRPGGLPCWLGDERGRCCGGRPLGRVPASSVCLSMCSVLVSLGRSLSGSTVHAMGAAWWRDQAFPAQKGWFCPWRARSKCARLWLVRSLEAVGPVCVCVCMSVSCCVCAQAPTAPSCCRPPQGEEPVSFRHTLPHPPCPDFFLTSFCVVFLAYLCPVTLATSFLLISNHSLAPNVLSARLFLANHENTSAVGPWQAFVLCGPLRVSASVPLSWHFQCV